MATILLRGYRAGRQKRRADKRQRGKGESRKGKNNSKGSGQTLNGFGRLTGLWNRCCKCDSGYHLSPRCPLKDAPRSDYVPNSPSDRKSPRPPCSSISMDSPVIAQADGSSVKEGEGSNCEQPSSTSSDLGGQFVARGAESVSVFDSEATANLVRVSLLGRRNKILESKGILRATTCRASAPPIW